MNKTIFRTCAAGVIVMGLAVLPLSAKEAVRPAERKESPRTEREVRALPGGGMFMRGGMMGAQGADLMGTVSAVSADKQTFTLKDADGKETVVHVNPLTSIRSFPKDKAAAADDKDEKKKNAVRKAPDNSLALEDVKPGDWLAVKKFGTDTKVAEASHVIVAK